MISVFQFIAADRALKVTWHQQHVIFSIKVEHLGLYSIPVIEFCDFLPYKVWKDSLQKLNVKW